jgi:hypothetical protein
VRERFAWQNVVEPLARLVAGPGRPVEMPSRARLAGARELYLGTRESLGRRGAAETLADAWHRKIRRSTRLR